MMIVSVLSLSAVVAAMAVVRGVGIRSRGFSVISGLKAITCGGAFVMRVSVSAPSMAVMATRSKEGMVLQVASDEIPKRIRWLIELVDGSHRELISDRQV